MQNSGSSGGMRGTYKVFGLGIHALEKCEKNESKNAKRSIVSPNQHAFTFDSV